MTRALAFIAACCAVSCSGPSGDETQVIPTGASREAFPAVADVLPFDDIAKPVILG